MEPKKVEVEILDVENLYFLSHKNLVGGWTNPSEKY